MANLSGKWQSGAGGILGISRGESNSIYNSYNIGDIELVNGTAYASTGGIVGYNETNLTIENCYFEVASSAKDASTVGGIVTEYTLINCVIVSDIQQSGQSGAIINWNPNILRDEDNNPYEDPRYYSYTNTLVIYMNDYKILSGARGHSAFEGVTTADFETADRTAIAESGFNYDALSEYFDTTGAIPVFKAQSAN